MKTYAVYGFVWALAGALLTLVLFFLGFHSAPEKLQASQLIALIGGVTIAIACLVLGTRARRNDVPAHEPFGYGRALAAGVMITLFATLFGVVFNYLYMDVINPGLKETMVQAQVAKMEEGGMSGAQLESAEAMARTMSHPALQAVFYVVIGILFGTVISLITSIFLRRPALTQQPPVVA